MNDANPSGPSAAQAVDRNVRDARVMQQPPSSQASPRRRQPCVRRALPAVVHTGAAGHRVARGGVCCVLRGSSQRTVHDAARDAHSMQGS